MLTMIQKAGIFMIIAQTMYHFVSGSKYARYVRLLIRVMTLAVLLVPLLNLVKSGTEADFQEKLIRFEREYEALLRGVEDTGENYVEAQIEQTTAKELKAMIDPVLAPYGYETASVYADGGGLLFTLHTLDGEGGEIGVRPIRRIDIQLGERPADRDTESLLADVIAAYLRVERSWVEVRILG